MKKISLLFVVLMFLPAFINADEEIKTIKLKQPQKEGGMPLMEAFSNRKSARDFSETELDEQLLSDLLWAAFGINREKDNKRTAPSAVNWQEIDIYVAMKSGLFKYNVKEHSLMPFLNKDIRANAGKQKFVSVPPVTMIYVADYSKMGVISKEEKDFYSATDTGFISQNVYLYCASAGLNTVVLGYVDKDSLGKIMDLRKDQKIILTQPVGYPIKKLKDK